MKWTLGAARRASAAVAVVMAAALCPAPVTGQFPPDSLTNLQVLPDDIAFRDLMDTMRGFTRALGVRCSHCHVGEEGQPLSEYDFAADDEPLKEKARVMLRMVRGINTRQLAGLDDRRDPTVVVQCYTCHRGVRVPRTIQDELRIAYGQGGADAVLERYDGLRDEYFGRGSYDFGYRPLAGVGLELAAADTAAAVAILRGAVKRFPEESGMHSALGAALEQAGDRAGAVAEYRVALELNPRNRQARQRLEELGG